MAFVLAVFFVLLPFAGIDGADFAQDAPSAAQPMSVPSRFVPVQGVTLADRLRAAVAAGRSTGGRYWAAYGFDVRRGVAVDFEWRNTNGVSKLEGLTIRNGGLETPNVAVFLQYDGASEQPKRVEIYNLDRKRTYGDLPVYWMGRADSGESLALLRGLLGSEEPEVVATRSIVAISLHADPRAEEILESIVMRGERE